MKQKDLKIELLPLKAEGEELTRIPAVKITHKPTNRSVTVDYGKSVEDNTKRAMELLETIIG